uniref:Uncharacterized protein n=1 Tax=Oryza sativa subsp. japonica TaxID=39947 RepID=Q69LK0_ORYSJ|nr:hypothetical protein [Oryza sativa Japonica Group]
MQPAASCVRTYVRCVVLYIGWRLAEWPTDGEESGGARRNRCHWGRSRHHTRKGAAAPTTPRRLASLPSAALSVSGERGGGRGEQRCGRRGGAGVQRASSGRRARLWASSGTGAGAAASGSGSGSVNALPLLVFDVLVHFASISNATHCMSDRHPRHRHRPAALPSPPAPATPPPRRHCAATAKTGGIPWRPRGRRRLPLSPHHLLQLLPPPLPRRPSPPSPPPHRPSSAADA